MTDNLPVPQQSIDDALRKGPDYSGNAEALPVLEAGAVVDVQAERGRAILRLHQLYSRTQADPAVALRVQQELNKLCGLYATQEGDMLPAAFVRERWELGVAAHRKAIEAGITTAIPILRRLKSEKSIKKCLTILILNAFDTADLDVDKQPESDADPV